MASKDKSVTLTKNGRKVTLTIPRDIVQYRAAGWREETTARSSEVPVADSPQDTTPRQAGEPTGKGGAKK